MRNFSRMFMVSAAIVALTGCEQAYRYPCQDPANWDTPECKRPICEVNRDCPDYIFEGNNKISLPPS